MAKCRETRKASSTRLKIKIVKDAAKSFYFGKMSNEESEDITESNQKIVDIKERAFAFAVRIVKLCRYLEKSSDVAKSVINQLLDAGTSVGANLEEAQAGQTKPDFIHKNSISLKEARESNFWLRLILATSSFDENVKLGIEELRDESLEIAKIIAKIVVNARK